MSKVVHKSPVWVWSPVVLLSTLLLSPTAATAFLHVYAAAAAASSTATPAAPASGSGQHNAPSAAAPRRLSDDEAQRDSGKNGPRRFLRFDDDPEYPDAFLLTDSDLAAAGTFTTQTATVAVLLVRVRTVEPVLDEAAPLSPRFAVSDAAHFPDPLRGSVPPRAPPFA